jgi:hypothetical protein
VILDIKRDETLKPMKLSPGKVTSACRGCDRVKKDLWIGYFHRDSEGIQGATSAQIKEDF